MGAVLWLSHYLRLLSVLILLLHTNIFAQSYVLYHSSRILSSSHPQTTLASFKSDPFGERKPPDRSAVELVMKKTLVPMKDAVRVLMECDGQIMDAVMMLNEEQREKLDESSSRLPEGGVDWDAEIKALSSINPGDQPYGADGGAGEKIANRKKKEKRAEQLSKWKLEGEDADWMPGFSAKDMPDSDEPWFTG